MVKIDDSGTWVIAIIVLFGAVGTSYLYFDQMDYVNYEEHECFIRNGPDLGKQYRELKFFDVPRTDHALLSCYGFVNDTWIDNAICIKKADYKVDRTSYEHLTKDQNPAFYCRSYS